MHVAIFENDLNTVKNLTALGINREHKNHENKEPLDLANLLGRKEIFKYLKDLKYTDRLLDEIYLQSYRTDNSNVASSTTQASGSVLSSARSNSR